MVKPKEVESDIKSEIIAEPTLSELREKAENEVNEYPFVTMSKGQEIIAKVIEISEKTIRVNFQYLNLKSKQEYKGTLYYAKSMQTQFEKMSVKEGSIIRILNLGMKTQENGFDSNSIVVKLLVDGIWLSSKNFN